MCKINLETSKGKFAFVKLPDNIKYNIGLSVDNILFGDTNDSVNWDYWSIQLDVKVNIIGFVKDLTEAVHY